MKPFDRDPPASTHTVVGEFELMALVLMVWAAVMLAAAVPLAVAAGPAVLALAKVPSMVSKLLVAVSLALLASSLGARADAAYVLASARTLTNEAGSLVTDTEPTDFGWRAEAQLRTTGQRVRLIGVGFQRPDLVAGQPVLISGRLGPSAGNDWERSRHVVGEVSTAEVVSAGDLAWWRRPGEWLRTGVLGATDSFDEDQAALYHGLVIGDDRFQSEGQQVQFRAAGLTHLLAVSGQNVAFLLAVIAPATGRLRPGLGLFGIGVALVIFALATRLEPSVLRATATAGVSAIATTRSARSTGVRSLAIAVVVLLLVDPLLAWSIGFRLSVGASAGILLVGPSIRERLPWPSWIADPASITLAAQLGVSPILLIAFGPIATVTVPANLLAGWAAGAVMTLGLSVGLVASVLPEPVAAVVQAPSRLLVWWIDAVAAEAAAAPLPAVSIASLPWISVGLLATWWLRPHRVLVAWWLIPAAGLVLVTAQRPVDLEHWFERTDATPSVLVVDAASGRWVEAIVSNRIRNIDVVIVADGGWATARTIDRLRDVAEIGVVLAPGDHRIVGGRRVLDDQVIAVGTGHIEVRAGPSHLEIEVVVVADETDR